MAVPPDRPDQRVLQAFIKALEQLQASTSRANLDGRSLHQHFLAAQQLYQQQLVPILTATAASTLTSYQTEINRTFRLLGMDVTFLQTAKHAMTVQKRQAQMQQRLQTLLGFSRELAQRLNDQDRASDQKPSDSSNAE